MAKGQKRSGREPKKAKAPPKKAAPAASIFSEPPAPPKKKTPADHGVVVRT